MPLFTPRPDPCSRVALALLGLALTPALPCAAKEGEAYPARPIRMIQPFSPGGTSDTLARILGAKLAERWGQPVVVDVRPGAAGITATELAARSPADGYTLLYGNCTQFTVTPYLYAKVGYDTLRDFAPISLTGTAPQLLVVPTGLAVRTVADLVQLARAKPGALNFGSGGAGTLAYIAGEMFRVATGVNIVHVPYKGTVLALGEIISGQIHLLFSDMPVALPHARSGRVRAIAVTGSHPTPLVPGVPTVQESGVPGYELVNWWGVLAPKGIPAASATRLHAEIVRIHALPDVRERYANLGVDPVTSTPAAFSEHIRTEAAAFARIIRASGARLE